MSVSTDEVLQGLRLARDMITAEKEGAHAGVCGLLPHPPYEEESDLYFCWMKGFWNEQVKREAGQARTVMTWTAGQLEEIARDVDPEIAEKLRMIATKLSTYAG